MASSEKPFWFRMDPAAFLQDKDVVLMTTLELGAYFRLLCRQGIDGYIPDDTRKQLDSGNCMICGDPRTLYATHCDACNEKVMAYQRSKTGFQPRKPGGRGRPPLKRVEVASASI